MPIGDMAARGAAKMSRKSAQMSSSWASAKGRMVANYRAVGFGPTRTRNYESGISAATHRVDVDKWQRNWSAKLFGALRSNLQVITGLIRGKLSEQSYANPELSGEKSPKCVETIYPAPVAG